jgi:hypothetical protein
MKEAIAVLRAFGLRRFAASMAIRQAGGDRDAPPAAAARAEDGGRETCLSREECRLRRQGKEVAGRRCGTSDQGFSRPSVRGRKPRTDRKEPWRSDVQRKRERIE